MAWRAASGEHSIEQAIVSVFHAKSLDQNGLDLLASHFGPAVASYGYNERIIQKSANFQIVFGPTGIGGSNAPKLDQHLFRKAIDGRLHAEIVLAEDQIVFISHNYTRWDPMMSELTGILKAIGGVLFVGGGLTDVRLEYIDRFDLDDDGEAVPLLNPEGTLAPPLLRFETGSYHCHVGFFIRRPALAPVLVNANVDVVMKTPGLRDELPPGIRGLARIHTMAGPRGPADDDGRGFLQLEPVLDVIQFDHNYLKSVLGDLLHPRLVEKIKLNPQPLSAWSAQ